MFWGLSQYKLSLAGSVPTPKLCLGVKLTSFLQCLNFLVMRKKKTLSL